MHLKQSTAVTIKMGPFLDSTDGNSEKTALSIAQADIRLTKNGGAYAQTNNAAGGTHDEKGNYGIPLNTTDTNTLGTLRVYIHMTGALPVWQDFMILPANVWDSLYGADNLQVDLLQIGGDAQSATDLKDFADTGYNPATHKVEKVVLCDTVTNYTGNTPQTGDCFAIVNNGTYGNAAIKGYVDDIGTAGAGLTAIPWNAAWDAEVQSEVQDAIEVNQLDHLLQVANPGGNIADSSLWAALTSKAATPSYATYNNTTDSQEALRDRGDVAWITATGFSTHTAADIWISATRTLTSAANITSTGGTTVPQTGDAFARLGAPAGASISADIQVIDDYVDTEVAAIKAKTDQITFTNANKVDAAVLAAADFATAVAQKLAAIILRRTMANVEVDANGDTLDLSSLYGFIQQAQESSITGTTLTVKKTDGTTTLGTKTVTTDVAADPVTGVS